MTEIINGQYDRADFTLKRFYITEAPSYIKDIVLKLNQIDRVLVRGGLAYIAITGDKSYQLEDIDMLSPFSNKEALISVLDGSADRIYINSNTFGERVITAFWKSGVEFFKTDILLSDDETESVLCRLDRQCLKTVSPVFLWKNRIAKIGEKEIRKHRDSKTISHFRVAYRLAEYMIKAHIVLSVEDIQVAEANLQKAKKVLGSLIDSCQLEQFMACQKQLISGGKTE